MIINKFAGWGPNIPGPPRTIPLTDRLKEGLEHLKTSVAANNPKPELQGMEQSIGLLAGNVAANNPKPELQGMVQQIGALAVNVAANNPVPVLQDVTYKLQEVTHKLGVLNDSVRDNNPMTGLALLVAELGSEGPVNERLESIARAVRSLGRRAGSSTNPARRVKSKP